MNFQNIEIIESTLHFKITEMESENLIIQNSFFKIISFKTNDAKELLAKTYIMHHNFINQEISFLEASQSNPLFSNLL